MIDVRVPGLPPQLDGLRVGHLSDLHLGSVSQNGRVAGAAVEWLAGEQCDLVCLSGDLLARRSGEAQLRGLLAWLEPPHGTYAVLGNVDLAETRDPFSADAHVPELEPYATLLSDSSATVDVRGRRVQVAGLAAASRGGPPVGLADDSADLRILLAHFPDSVDRVREPFGLVLSGHTHGGQICLPAPGGRVHLAQLGRPLRPRYAHGVFELPATTLVVSRGSGTTFVPFRLFARPEVAVLVLRPR